MINPCIWMYLVDIELSYWVKLWAFGIASWWVPHSLTNSACHGLPPPPGSSWLIMCAKAPWSCTTTPRSRIRMSRIRISCEEWMKCRRASVKGNKPDVEQDRTGPNTYWSYCDMGLSENSVPLNPMVIDHYPLAKLKSSLPWICWKPHEGSAGGRT